MNVNLTSDRKPFGVDDTQRYLLWITTKYFLLSPSVKNEKFSLESA